MRGSDISNSSKVCENEFINMTAQNHLFKRGDFVSLEDGSIAQIVDYIATGGQGEVYHVNCGGESFALKWYYNPDYSKKNNVQYYDNLSKLVKFVNSSNNWFKGKLTLPLKLTRVDENGHYGFIMNLIPKEMVPMTDVLSGRKNFDSGEAMIRACRNISSSVGLFHTKYKKSFMDINDGSIFFNLKTGDVMICDCDNIAADEEITTTIGKMGYMAPEICLGAKKCSIQSDLHSLAVILYTLLLRDKPFEGKATSGIMDREHEIEVYGKHPVFVFDPDDDSNRPRDQSVEKIWNNEINSDVRELFITTFTEGLKDPSKRIKSSDWNSVFEYWLEGMENEDPFTSMPVLKPVPKRIQIVIFVIDSSDSMKDAKMEEVNKAIMNCIPDLANFESNNFDTKFEIDLLQFSRDCKWSNEKPMPLSEFEFKKLETTGSATKFEKACMELDKNLVNGRFLDQNRPYRRPIIILLSDGGAIDYEDYLDELKNNKIFAKSIKVAIGIDDKKSKSSLTMLKNFTGDEDYVIKTDKIRGRLADLIHNMTIQVSRASITEHNDEEIKKVIVQFKR